MPALEDKYFRPGNVNITSDQKKNNSSPPAASQTQYQLKRLSKINDNCGADIGINKGYSCLVCLDLEHQEVLNILGCIESNGGTVPSNHI